jgi:2-keto-4-pentenoate hydratase/2-oxohepta-3-ene-1,7-dioic acid hydratase in catechol pathway
MIRRYMRIRHEQTARFAELEDDALQLLDRPPYAPGCERTGERVALADADVVAPVEPSKIVCIGRNYRAHAEELGNRVPSEPLLFLKPPSSIIGPQRHVELPPQSQRVEHEVELGVVIGSRARGVDAARAHEHVFGFTVVGDITARDLQRSDKTWARGKGFDTFCPVGPTVVTGIDSGALDVVCTVNGEVRQHGNTSQMVFSPAHLIAYISEVMTLEPGDLVATGTPAGVGPLDASDAVVMRVERVGELSFGVKER